MATFIRLRSKTTREWLVNPKLRDKLVKEASKNKTNMTDVIIKILSDRYSIPYEAGGRPTVPAEESDVINLGEALTERLERTIKTAAAREPGRTWIDQIRHDLCDYYGLKMPPKPVYRRPGRKTAARKTRAK